MTLTQNPPAVRESPAITIGGRVLATRYFLAPLAGYTHLPFRTAVRELGGVGLATTDLILTSQMLAESRKSKRLLQTTAADRPLSVQIFGSDPDELAEGAKFLEGRGYGGVDINMGCPMAKITGSGGGARLACDPQGATGLVRRVVEAVEIPVTVKMRLGWDRTSTTAPALTRAFAGLGVAAVTIHGRTRQQGFSGAVDLDGIAATVAAAEGLIPVVGNGDVRSAADALHMRRVTGCDAVAIGRGAMLDPWIFRKIADAEVGRDSPDPTAEELIAFLVRHVTLMHEQLGEYGCVEFRKFAAWYGARLGIPEDLEDRLRRIESLEQFEAVVAEIRDRHGERQSSVPTALIRTPNGPVERW